jgi:hypothetical protein
MTAIKFVTEKETFANGTDEVIRLQWYSWVAYDANGDFESANPSGDNFKCALSTLKRRGYKLSKTQYFYTDADDNAQEFFDFSKCPVVAE